MKTAIEVADISKKFPLEKIRRQRKKSFQVLFGGFPKETFVQALSGVSFKVDRGECVGIVGSNGSGKSTLLGVIAGILGADSGSVRSFGKVVSLLDTKLGRQDLSGEENRCFLSTLFGIPQKEIKKMGKEVFKRAGLEEFADAPMLKYSRGMKDRLMLSMVLCANADILLLDEVFAESDERFRKQCIESINALIANGKVVVLISHELALIERVCTRTIWLEKGILRMDGSTQEVLKRYQEGV